MRIALGHDSEVAARRLVEDQEEHPKPRTIRMIAPTMMKIAPRHDGPPLYGLPAPSNDMHGILHARPGGMTGQPPSSARIRMARKAAFAVVLDTTWPDP